MADSEELRKKKVEENRRKLEQLKLVHPSPPAPTAPNTHPAANVKGKAHQEESTIARESNPIADSSHEKTYREVNPEVAKPQKRYFQQGRDLSGQVFASDKARKFAQTKAEELESGLGAKFSSFVRPMLKSHTSGGFSLNLPTRFCDKHLRGDSKFILIDEDDSTYETSYLARRRSLSAGWKNFSIAHELVDGDALVFELVKPTEFKVQVYIIRASGYSSS